MAWIYDWEGAAHAGAAVCGGKGWNLGRLHRYGFPVPRGGVVAAEAYIQVMSSSELKALAEPMAEIGANEVVRPDATARIAAVHEAVAGTALPEEAAGEIVAFLLALGLADVPLAVRSSATAEDGEEASFAGIHQSFLNVRGTQAVLAAVARCYASLWTPQAVAYRRHRGLADDAVACAVVICEMVDPAVAGVAFSCDPRIGRRDLLTISAAPGLGEGVVGGSVNPEEIAVRKHVSAFALVGRRGRPDQVLSDEQALTLARLTDRIHWAFGDDQAPQDVEWAYDGHRFWVLQARPVTRLPLVTFPGAEQFPIIWSNANLKDAVAGVQSTLSWSVIKYVISYVLHTSLPLAGYPVPEGLEVVRRFQGRAYFDLTALMWAMYDAIAITPPEFIRTLGGHQPLIPVPPGDPLKGPEGRRRSRARLKFMLSVRRVMRGLPREMAQLKPVVKALRERIGANAPAEDLLKGLAAAQSLTVSFGPLFQTANMNAGLWPSMLEQLVDRLAPGRGQALTSALIAGSGKVTSAEHGYRLFDLARLALAEPAAMAYLDLAPQDPQGWRSLPTSSAFRRELEAFLEEFGHRAVYEGELANPRWREDPTYLLEQVGRLARSGRTTAPRESARAARAAGEAGLTALPWWSRGIVRWIAGKAQEGAALREATKSALGSISEPVRVIVLEIARRLVAAGKLDRAEDVFHLAQVELEMFLRGEWDGSGARALVADRKARDAAWLEAEPADSFVLDAAGRPAELPAEMAATVPAPRPVEGAGANRLSGVGVAAGRAAGVARVIRHPHQGHLLQDGEILVAPSTDPGWTPLFLRASAVVMEVGGYLSHGAIVSREYGLPAVVNIPGLLSTIRDGQRLLVDGDAGTVAILE